jgi:hypothetical protein
MLATGFSPAKWMILPEKNGGYSKMRELQKRTHLGNIKCSGIISSH